MRTLELELDGGGSIFVEVEPTRRRDVLDEEDVAIGAALKAHFSKVSGAIVGIAKSVGAQIGEFKGRPDSIVLELEAKLKGEADLFLVQGDGEASIKITMTWTAPDDSGKGA